MTEINSLADLRPGDIMFGPIGGMVGLGVGLGQLALGEGFRVGRLSIRHVGIVVEASVLHEGVTLYDGEHDRYLPIEDAPGPLKTCAEAERAGYVVYPTGVQTRPKLVQAMPHGAEEIDMTAAAHWTDRHAYVRLPEDYPGQAQDAATVARLMVAEGVAYSPASYLALAAWRWGMETPRLGKWIERRRPFDASVPYDLPSGKELRTALPMEAICSVLVDQCWTLTGKEMMRNVAHQVVPPGLMAGQLLTRRGAIWGGPAWQ